MNEPNKAMTENNWWATFFDEQFGEAMLARDQATVEQLASQLTTLLALQPGQRVLDQCCGQGDVAHALAKSGYQVVGVDQSPGYIRQAQRQAQQHNLNAQFHEADARTFVAEPACHAGINWYTSFGYSEDDADNVRMLHRAYESLVPGGWFALDYMNVLQLRKNFQPVFRRSVNIQGQAVELIKHTTLDETCGMVRSRWEYQFADGRRHEAHGASRLFGAAELIQLFKAAGFLDLQVLGGLAGESLDGTSKRCIVVGAR